MHALRPSLALLAALVLSPPALGAAPDEGPFEPQPLPRTGPRPPWPKRQRQVKGLKARGQELIDLSRWPAEPRSPAPVDEQQLAQALRRLCGGWMPPRRPLAYARWILAYGREFEVDPFLLAALIYRQSRCIPQEQTEFGVGLAKIDERMHAPFIRKRRYTYHVLEGGEWKERQLALGRFAFARGNLRRAEPSIYFAAALLRIARDQCPAIDSAFGSVPHRHAVSHLVWGDQVREAAAEDRVFAARRRLVAYYSGTTTEPLGKFQGLKLHCPLEGPPHKITSGLGSDREDGKRAHRGLDFSSTWGEPVLAVADGRVTLAGVDRKLGGPLQVDPEQAAALRSSEMGPGGLFVMIRHDEGLTSAYMHLASYLVRANQTVKGGEVIGYVGKTGIRDSGAHLHFELRHGGRHIDPMPHLEPYLFPPKATYLGRKVAAEERRLRRRRRVQRWRERQAERATPPSATGRPGS